MIDRINEIKLTGRLGKDAETLHTGTGKAVTKFDIAAENSGSGKPDPITGKLEPLWVRVEAWEGLSESATGFRKGDRVYVEGSLKTDNFTNKAGDIRKGFRLSAAKCDLIPRAVAEQITTVSIGADSQEIDDSDIPF